MLLIGALVGIVFKVVTFPGLLINRVVQAFVEESYDVPTTRIAVDEEGATGTGDEGTDLDPAAEPAAAGMGGGAGTGSGTGVRILGDGERAAEGETEHVLVDYDAIESYPTLFKLVIYPFAATSLLGLAVYVATAGLLSAGVLSFDGVLAYGAVWFGFAISAHAFPNGDPTSALWRRSKATDSTLRFVGYPLVAAAVGVNALRFLWADAIYALGLWALVGYAFGVYGF